MRRRTPLFANVSQPFGAHMQCRPGFGRSLRPLWSIWSCLLASLLINTGQAAALDAGTPPAEHRRNRAIFDRPWDTSRSSDAPAPIKVAGLVSDTRSDRECNVAQDTIVVVGILPDPLGETSRETRQIARSLSTSVDGEVERLLSPGLVGVIRPHTRHRVRTSDIGEASDTFLARWGCAEGAEYVVGGTILKQSDLWQLRIEVRVSSTGQPLVRRTLTARDVGQLQAALHDAMPTVVATFTGMVAHLQSSESSQPAGAPEATPFPSKKSLSRDLVLVAPVRTTPDLPGAVVRRVESTLQGATDVEQHIERADVPALPDEESLGPSLVRAARREKAGYAISASVEKTEQGFHYELIGMDARRSVPLVYDVGDPRDELLLRYSLENGAFKFAQRLKDKQNRKRHERRKGAALLAGPTVLAITSWVAAELIIDDYETLGPLLATEVYDKAYTKARVTNVVRWAVVGADVAAIGLGCYWTWRW